MRIGSGKYRGRVIKPPKGADIRITRDEVKAALFNILGQRVNGAKILELYAGSGNLGIEALSRGASKVIFVDNNIKCIEAVQSNLKALGINDLDDMELLDMDAIESLELMEKRGEKFDLIIMDPPYYRELAKNSLIKASACDIIKHLSLVIVEHFKKDILPQECGKLVLVKQRNYGDTVLSFYGERI